MRKCNKCKTNDVRSSQQYKCASCHNDYQKAWYKTNRKRILPRFRLRKKSIRDLVIEAKNIPCVDCKEKYPYYVMDLDHIKGNKKFNLSIAASRGWALNTIKKEIDKCEVVCANCHRKRTFERELLRNGGIGNTSVSETEDSRIVP